MLGSKTFLRNENFSHNCTTSIMVDFLSLEISAFNFSFIFPDTLVLVLILGPFTSEKHKTDERLVGQ